MTKTKIYTGFGVDLEIDKEKEIVLVYSYGELQYAIRGLQRNDRT